MQLLKFKRFNFLMAFILFFAGIVGCINEVDTGVEANKPDRKFWTPYQDLNWQEVGYYDSEFHTHPGLGDEKYDPHQTVDRYYAEGYKILSLAGHSYDIPDEIDSIYPWTQLSDIYETIKDIENPTEDDKTYKEIANEPYENRNPVDLGMISVEGNEVSAPHHTVSLFNSTTDGKNTEEETYQAIGEQGGIAYFAHPGRYVESGELAREWYIDMYNKYDFLIGQAIFNRKDSYPGDRVFYDKVAHSLGADRPIWLYGEDDMHSEHNLGWNRDVILLEGFKPGSIHSDIQDGLAPEVLTALKNGYTYLWKPAEQYNKRAFNIVNVVIADNEINLRIDNPEEVDEISWKTHNPKLDTTVTVHSGYSIVETLIPKYSKFVRAEIYGDEGTIYTQPFYLVKNN